ncbi:hypothetical protein [Pseudonocardia sp. T1-2H]|uniref:hypothetical protein n=1 Tax=Pseudonocardia sp. T1-2H TaxID=3128899 RepID=UPI003101493F
MIMETLRREKGRDLMTNTVTHTAARAAGGAQQAGREFGRRVAGGAARKVMSEAGSVVLGAVVDMAVSRVDRVADRLDRVAESGGTGLREALTGRPAPLRSDRKDAGDVRKTGRAVRVRMDAAFSLVVARAVALLQFLQRLALKLLEALRRLARRSRTAPPEPRGAGADEDGPEQDAAGEDSEPSERRGSRADRRPRTQRRDAPGPRPGRSVPAEPAVRRGRPTPPSSRVGGGK